MDVFWESSIFTLKCNRDNPISREDSFMPTKNTFFDNLKMTILKNYSKIYHLIEFKYIIHIL